MTLNSTPEKEEEVDESERRKKLFEFVVPNIHFVTAWKRDTQKSLNRLHWKEIKQCAMFWCFFFARWWRIFSNGRIHAYTSSFCRSLSVNGKRSRRAYWIKYTEQKLKSTDIRTKIHSNVVCCMSYKHAHQTVRGEIPWSCGCAAYK